MKPPVLLTDTTLARLQDEIDRAARSLVMLGWVCAGTLLAILGWVAFMVLEIA